MTKRQVADRLLDRLVAVRAGLLLAQCIIGSHMSATNQPQPAGTAKPERRVTVADIAKMHADGRRIAMLTAYDYPTARIVDEAGIPLILVGDSLGMVMLGYEETVRVSMDEMLHHTKAVVRGTRRSLVVGDMPFLSYGVDGAGDARECRRGSSAKVARRRSRSRAAFARRGPSRPSRAPASR